MLGGLLTQTVDWSDFVVSPTEPSNDDELRAMFDELDTDSSGELDRSEICTLLDSLGRRPTEDQLDILMARMDPDSSGEVSATIPIQLCPMPFVVALTLWTETKCYNRLILRNFQPGIGLKMLQRVRRPRLLSPPTVNCTRRSRVSMLMGVVWSTTMS